jgi:hypothetical protein
MKPIHEYLMNSVLRKMPCDGSFGHDILANKVKKFTKHRGLYCYDLTAATDRFPLEIQKRVLRPLLGDLVHEWSDLLVNRPFTFKGEEIRYAVGQPMGLLTSWPALSVAHHVIINYCKKDKSFYAVIGDDVGISSKEGAMRYRDLMNEIGVSINDSKSLIPTNSNKVAEIAKRQYSEGKEISPIPPRVLVESTKSLEGLIEFLQVLANRTGKFRDLSGLELSSVENLIISNKEFEDEKFQVTLTCPFNNRYNPLRDYLDIVHPLRERVESMWNTSMPTQTYQGEYERWFKELAVKAINTNPMAFIALGLSTNAPRTGDSQITPLVKSYLDTRYKFLEKLIRVTLAHHGHDDWDDDHVTSPEEVYDELISGPDPLSPKDFMEKRRIRRKQSIDLLYRYYSASRFARPRPWHPRD